MKPKIYGYCKAGCQWEAVLKEDFDRIASVIKQGRDADGIYRLNPLNAYKVHTTKTDGKYQATFTLKGGGVNHDFKYTEFDEYRDYIIFEILILASNENATGLTIVYEINGNRYREQLGGYAGLLDVSKIKLQISGATDVYSFNNNAEIIADNQQTYETAVESEGDECPETLPSNELYTVPAAMYEGQRMPRTGDLVLYRFDVENSKGQNVIVCKITRLDTNGVYMQALYFAQGTGGGGGISGVQVNGTSVVTDGVANIPAASEEQAGVVTTEAQTFTGNKTFKGTVWLYPSSTSYVALNCAGAQMLGVGTAFVAGAAATANNPNGVPRAKLHGDGYIDLYGYGSSGLPYISVGNSYNSTKRLYFPLGAKGTLMSAPETWSTGTSGTAKLPSAGLYEIKTLVQRPNPEATYGFVIHSVIYWDGTNEASGELIRTPTISASTCKEFYVSETGVIYFGETDLDGFGGGTISTQISYRKIGIA